MKKEFSILLNEYMKRAGCSNASLAEASGLSASTIGRYRTGERIPDADGGQLEQLASGLSALLSKTPPEDGSTDKETILSALRKAIGFPAIPYELWLSNLNTLIDTAELSNIDLARALNYDPSLISRILSGKRRPADRQLFSEQVVSVIRRRNSGGKYTSALSGLINISRTSPLSEDLFYGSILKWLGFGTISSAPDPLRSFLEKLDAFDMNEYIRTIRYDEIKVPTVPFQLPQTKVYKGISEMMESELDFMKATVLSRRSEPVIIYSDMPLEEMASDQEFPKKYLYGMAVMLKKGLHLHFIHDVNRPFAEMMLGLESYIPMYMTGQITPHYLPASQSDTFCHLIKVSGAAALIGSSIAGHQADGLYTLYKSGDDVLFFRKQAYELLEKTNPLMDIYRSDRKAEFSEHLVGLFRTSSGGSSSEAVKMITSVPPLFTLTESSLRALLDRFALPKKNVADILSYRRNICANMEEYLKEHELSLELPQLPDKEDFRKYPPQLDLSELFQTPSVAYDRETLKLHMKETEAFASAHPHFQLHYNSEPVFRNIRITIFGTRCVIVSKQNDPAIHFIIHHPRMVRAFADFIPPLEIP